VRDWLGFIKRITASEESFKMIGFSLKF